MLPADHVQVRTAGGEAVPHWLGAEDYVWLHALIDDFSRLSGRPWREVRSFLQEPSQLPSPAGKRRMAVWTFQQLSEREPPPLDASLLRDVVAVEAQNARKAGKYNRRDILAAAAQRFGLSAAKADESLFADFPDERRLRLPRPLPDHHSLAMRTNVALAQGLLRLASEVTIVLYGGARAVVRQVHLRRLLCTVQCAASEGVRLDISGAFSLFRHTTMYGRALASILPLLAWCGRFELTARCMLRGKALLVRLRSGDPITIGERPRAYDSGLEERFARDFGRANLDWDLVREPEPVKAGDTLVFPDFALIHRRDAARRFLLEIVGFWTPDYLRAKLDRLRAMPDTPMVLCIDRALNCGEDELPAHSRVVWFRKRIDPAGVLAAIEAPAPEIATHVEGIGPGDLFIDWAGRFPAADPVHERLATLKVGDHVRLRKHEDRVAIETEAGPVAMLSRPGCARWISKLAGVVSARVTKKLERLASQTPAPWRHQLQCRQWTVPVVEVVLATPDSSSSQEPSPTPQGRP